MSDRPLDVLVLGASYGLLPAVRMALAGHRVTVVGRPEERDALAGRGATLAFERGGPEAAATLHAPARPGPSPAPGVLGLVGPDADPAAFDLAMLAMAEPQAAAAEIAGLVGRIAAAATPVVSLMNLPPATFLRRIDRLDVAALRPAYAAWDAWDRLDPDRVTAASPDAQAVRRDPARPDRLAVTLASNLKVAPFARPADQALLARLAADVGAFRPGGRPLPVRIVAHEALHVPLAKWPMLVAGNCRSLREDGTAAPIAEAVGADPDESRRLYDRVLGLARALGARERDLVPFAAYAAAARALVLPSSLARALAAGATRVERVDRLVQLAGRSAGWSDAALDAIVARIDAALRRNAGAAAG